jgi:hypothetical protein
MSIIPRHAIRFAARRGRAAVLGLSLAMSGCATSWKIRQAAPQEVLRSTGETYVQVILTTGARVEMRDPGVEGDSLIGWSKGKGDEPPEREAFALSDVRALATKQNNLPLNITLGVVTGTAVAFSLVGVLLVLCASAGCD